VRRNLGQHQREGIIRTRLDGGIDVGEGVALVGAAGRALAAREPAVADAALLANARLVLEHQPDAFAWM
jgi:hypothetical protein